MYSDPSNYGTVKSNSSLSEYGSDTNQKRSPAQKPKRLKQRDQLNNARQINESRSSKTMELIKIEELKKTIQDLQKAVEQQQSLIGELLDEQKNLINQLSRQTNYPFVLRRSSKYSSDSDLEISSLDSSDSEEETSDSSSSGSSAIDNPLRTAAMKGNVEELEQLLKNGADAKKCDALGDSLLVAMLESSITDSKKFEMTKLLIKYVANIRDKWDFGESSVTAAIKYIKDKKIRYEVVNMLLKKDSSVLDVQMRGKYNAYTCANDINDQDIMELIKTYKPNAGVIDTIDE